MAASRSTRQLLGELDALMDQMLSLPVDDSGPRTATVEPPPIPRDDPPTVPQSLPLHPLAVTMTLLDIAEETPADQVSTEEIGARAEQAETGLAVHRGIEPAPSVEI